LRSLVDRLESKLLPVAAKRPEVKNYVSLLQRFREESRDMSVWLLIDDIDSTFIGSTEFILKLATFFSACRKLAREIDNLRIRASVRADVWTMLRHHEDLDKAEQYMTDISWSYREIEVILARRILAYLEREQMPGCSDFDIYKPRDAKKIIYMAFRDKMRWGATTVDPVVPINILSAKRPRWMVQLCRLASKHAARNDQSLIGIQDISAVMRRFGKLRLSDLHKEHAHQMPRLQSVLEVYAGGKAIYSTNELLTRLEEKIIARAGIPIVVEGETVSTAVELAHFLYRIGFIWGRSKDRGDPWVFVSYDDRPDLLREKANLDDGLDWSIYPSYRNVLRIKQLYA
jgi:hypothetical protein